MDKASTNQQHKLLEEIHALLAKTTLDEEIKKEVLGCLPSASLAKLARLKFSLLIRLLIESQKETIDKFRKEGKSLATKEDLDKMAKKTLFLLFRKEDEAISAAESALIGSKIKRRNRS